LSDAIATGRVLLEPKAGFLFDGDKSGCALGMACIANGGRALSATEDIDIPMMLWPWLAQCNFYIPCQCKFKKGAERFAYGQTIAALVDGHVMGAEKDQLHPEEFPGQRWTADQLIGWVRSVEPQEVEVEETPVVSEEGVASAA